MAADKKIMAEIETLRLDRPGRVYQKLAAVQRIDPPTPGDLTAALGELAATYREEAELWAKSGAKGWKGNEADALIVADRIAETAAQLDNAGGGAALSVSTAFPDNGCTHGADCNIHPEADGVHNFDAEDARLEGELREVATRVDALQRTGASGLDALIADSVRERRGHVRDEFLDPGSPARSDAGTQPERKTAHDWNDDPRIDPYVVSWSDFGSSAYALGVDCGSSDWPKPITRADFERARDGGPVTVAFRTVERKSDGTLLIDGEDVSAYLSGEVDDLPGLAAALVPSSVHDMTDEGGSTRMSLPPGVDQATVVPYPLGNMLQVHADAVRAVDGPDAAEQIAAAELVLHPNGSEHGPDDRNYSKLPKTWESDTMTADGLRVPGATKAPLLGQPGDAGSGYSHTYVPAGGRVLRFDELLQPVPAAALPPHLSHSQIGDVGDCGVQYRLQRVDKLPQVPQWANIGGTAFHAAVESWERTAAQYPAWKHHFEEQIRIVAASSPVPISVWRASRKGAEGRAWWEVNGPLMLKRYLDKRPSDQTLTVDSGGTPAIEWEVTAQVPTNYGPVPFKAQIDRVTISEDGRTLTIRDYKSSYERPTDTTQLSEYAWVLVLAGHVPAGVKVMGTYFDARRGEWTEPVDLLQEHPFEAFQYRVTAAHGQKRALTVGPTPARPSSYCGGCSVRYACPVMNQRAAVAPPPAPVTP